MKQFLMKQMMKAQIKKLPRDQQDAAMRMVDEHPDLLMTIAEEAQEEMKKNGGNQMLAMMTVAKRHEAELKAIAPHTKN
ncbi:MAG TPA: hypothetical protein VFL98_00835 [Candidatus Paceibacterota bacterium]|nr:hypothetical protein [Candidatus Paceibacterota bacterium]